MDNGTLGSFSAPAYIRISEQIRKDIAAGVWALGQHITMTELRSRYGVSGNPVREALQQLQGAGLLEIRPHRGAVVCQVDAAFIKNVYDVRGAIEAMLAREAARLATPEDIALIERHVAAYEAAAAGGEIVVLVQTNRDLHRTINSIAKNPIAVEIFDGRSSLIDALRRTLGNRPGRVEQIVREHRAIFEAIAAGDGRAAARLALQHTLGARDHMLQNINEAIEPRQ
jgi:DNA-binding GntR family transcriptional regulator